MKMSLENLLKINKLQTHHPSRESVQRLLQAAVRNIEDARIEEISGETRFDAAYKCIMQCAMLGLWANGFRTSTNQPGHHQTAAQALPKTMAVSPDVVIVLDALRKQRNLSDYEGDPVTPAAMNECIRQARALLGHTRAWLNAHRQHLLSE